MDVEHFVDIRIAEVIEITGPKDPSVVDQNIHLAELANGGFDDVLGALCCRDRTLARDGSAPGELISSATASARPSSISLTTTSAPRLANSSA